MEQILSSEQLNVNDFNEWISELKEILVRAYNFSIEQAEKYGANENWTDYYDDGYTPREAVLEDSEYWDAE